jgi:hypothetical protein
LSGGDPYFSLQSQKLPVVRRRSRPGKARLAPQPRQQPLSRQFRLYINGADRSSFRDDFRITTIFSNSTETSGAIVYQMLLAGPLRVDRDMQRRIFLASLGAKALGTATASPAAVHAPGDRPLKFGVLTDMTGAFADSSGKGSVIAAQLAIEECGGQALGKPIHMISADHQSKPDIESNIARDWYDENGVDVILDVLGSSICIAVQNVVAIPGQLADAQQRPCAIPCQSCRQIQSRYPQLKSDKRVRILIDWLRENLPTSLRDRRIHGD